MQYTFSCGLTNWLLQVSPAASLKTLMARWMMYRDECFRNISREPPMTGELFGILPQVMAGVAVTVTVLCKVSWGHS